MPGLDQPDSPSLHGYSISRQEPNGRASYVQPR